MMDERDFLVETRDLTKKYGPRVVAADSVSLTVRRGEVYGVVVEVAAVGVNFIEKTVRAGAFARAGNGIGCAVELIEQVRRVVAGHGGEVSVDSKPGQTLFTVRLPKTNRETGD
jgi:hypothetical protein